MSPFQSEERYFKKAEFAHAQALSRNPSGFLPEDPDGTLSDRVEANAAYLPGSQPEHVGRAPETAPPEGHPPYVVEVEVNCDECGGSGFDPGSIDPWGPEQCGVCRGAKTLKITRNYLAEAFQIAANQESTRPVERQHLVAVIQHCRRAVSVVLSLPEVA